MEDGSDAWNKNQQQKDDGQGAISYAFSRVHFLEPEINEGVEGAC
jgi:hypothetical protein